MAGLGFKDFQVGEVLTSADVDGYLMQQSVMRFADAGARGSALGTAVGTGVPLAEGMVTYLDDANRVDIYTGSRWNGVGHFTAGTAITATNASWPVPTLASPIVKVTVVGGGGGGGGVHSAGNAGGSGGDGGTTTFNAGGAGTVTAAGGLGGKGGQDDLTGSTGTAGLSAGNGGGGGISSDDTRSPSTGANGNGGAITVAYLNLSGISTVNVTIGAGGAAGANRGAAGGRGEVIVEYLAG